MNLMLAVICWKWAQTALKKQRYSDDVTRGKGAS
jgi:hypothetical protein